MVIGGIQMNISKEFNEKMPGLARGGGYVCGDNDTRFSQANIISRCIDQFVLFQVVDRIVFEMQGLHKPIDIFDKLIKCLGLHKKIINTDKEEENRNARIKALESSNESFEQRKQTDSLVINELRKKIEEKDREIEDKTRELEEVNDEPDGKLTLTTMFPNELRCFLTRMRCYTDEIQFAASNTDIMFRGMDPSSRAMFKLFYLSSRFAEFDCSENVLCKFNVHHMLAVLSRAKKDDALMIETGPGKLFLTIQGNRHSRFTVATTAVTNPIKDMDLDFGANIGLDLDKFRDMVKAVEKKKDYIRVKCTKTALNLFSVSQADMDGFGGRETEKVKADAKLTKLQDETLRIRAKNPAESVYFGRFIKDAIIPSPVGNSIGRVGLNFSTDFPLKISYNVVDKYLFEFVIAPEAK
jgi:hypothetical protein